MRAIDELFKWYNGLWIKVKKKDKTWVIGLYSIGLVVFPIAILVFLLYLIVSLLFSTGLKGEYIIIGLAVLVITYFLVNKIGKRVKYN